MNANEPRTRRCIRSLLQYAIHVLGLMLATFSIAEAQSYPTRPVRVIVPFGAGGMPDIIARGLGEKLSKSLGQPFVVDNRPGAGGNTGAAIAAAASPDGYHMLATPGSVLTINPGLYTHMPFDPAVAFAPVSLVADMPIVLVVNARGPATDIHQFIGLMKRQPDKAAFSSPGVGSALHLAGELFNRAAATTMRHVPYKSGGQSVTAVLSGEVPATFTNLLIVQSHLKAGSLRALGVGNPSRMSQWPDVPTIAEAGLPGFEATSWLAVMMPAKTPRALIEKMSEHIALALREPDLHARFAEMGVNLVGSSPDELSGYIRRERERWQGIIRSAHITID